MNATALSVRQFRFEFRSFFRNKAGMVFTLAFPIMFLLIFGLGSHGKTQDFNGHTVPQIQFFVPGIIAYAVIGANYTTLAIRTVNQRETGLLKRIAGTPLPKVSYIVGQILTSVVIGLILTVVTLLVAKLAYGVHIYPHTLPAAIVAIVLASGTFSAIGLAVASVIPNADASNGIIQFTLWPILFISDIFYSISGAPKWLDKLSNFFPVRHFANSLQIAFDPATKGNGFNAHHLEIIAIWGVVAAVWAARHFKWESSKG